MNSYPFVRSLRGLSFVFLFFMAMGNLSAQAVIAVADPDADIASEDTSDFGTVVVGGTTSTIEFTITNTGTTDLTSLAVTIVGTDAADFNISAPLSATTVTTTPPNDSATFTVEFDPTSIGDKAAQVEIASNDSASPFIINLTGTGASLFELEQPAGEPVVDGDTKEFGEIVVGSGKSSNLVFTLTNNGDTPLSVNVALGGGSPNFQVDTSALPNGEIPAGGNSTVTVSFNPLELSPVDEVSGDYIPDTNTLTFSGTGIDTINVNLEGIGAEPPAGEDGFGYKYTVKASSIIQLDPDDDTVVSVDPSSAPFGLDDTLFNASIGFDFSFYDNVYDSCQISTNGLILFGEPSTKFSPDSIPNAASPNNFIAPFWTDLIMSEVRKLVVRGPGDPPYDGDPEDDPGVLVPNEDRSSRILYTTRGERPNRVFIIEFRNMYSRSDYPTFFEIDGTDEPSPRTVTFQALLHEGTNKIEIQYKRAGSSFNRNSITVGIESEIDERTGDISNEIGFKNQVPFSDFNAATEFPFAIEYERPVVLKVTSNVRSPLIGDFELQRDVDGELILDVDNNPIPVLDENGIPLQRIVDVAILDGVLTPQINEYKLPFGEVQKFDAPEFLYFNKNFVELEEMGEVNEENDNDVAYYRLRNKGYTIVGDVSAGSDFTFEQELVSDMIVQWVWELEYAIFVQSVDADGVPFVDEGLANGLGNPAPETGRVWIPAETDFSASVDRVVVSGNSLDPGGLRFNAESYVLEDSQGFGVDLAGQPVTDPENPVVVPLPATGDRVFTAVRTINDWLKIQWRWQGQARYRFGAQGEASLGSAPFAQQSFIRLYQEDDPETEYDESQDLEITEESASNGIIYGSAPLNEIWIDLKRKVDVGAFYRTRDNDVTLTNFGGTLGGDLAEVGNSISAFTDIMIEDPSTAGLLRVARFFPISSVSAPTRADFSYGGSVFRAVVPLGSAIAADSDPSAFVPALPEGAELSDEGPDFQAMQPVGRLALDPKSGSPLRWDKVSRRLFPVHVGSTQILWPDKNDPSISYKIEIASGYPGDTIQLASAREEESGMRKIIDGGSPTDYDSRATLDGLDPDFPAAPIAHYNHLFDPLPERRPATNLDVSTTDHWYFHEVTYSDLGTNGLIDNETGRFTVSNVGRTVLLYSYRPNPDEIATGDLSKEEMAVRVVNSKEIVSISSDDDRLVLGTRSLVLGTGDSAVDGAYGVIGSSSSLDFSGASNGGSFLIDFWLNAKTLGREAEDQVSVLSMGDGKLSVTLDGQRSTVTANYFGMEVTHPFVRAGNSWHHYIVHVFEDSFFGVNVTVMNFYLDGVREENGSVTGQLPIDSTQFDIGSEIVSGSLTFGAGADPRDQLQLDHVRLFVQDNAGSQNWLTPVDINNLRSDKNATVQGMSAALLFDFDSPPSGGSFVSSGSITNAGVGPIPSGSLDDFTARAGLQEVAIRIDSTLDNANFGGSGYILNQASNYNASLYDRAADVGAWGPIFPVNHSQLFSSPDKILEVVYYENPYIIQPNLHPNVSWPYIATSYNDVIYPTYGPSKDNAIYVTSRVGSEGIDLNGRPQKIYDLATYSDMAIYQQGDRTLGGFNPNEEHALVAASGRAALKVKNLGEGGSNNPSLAAFALQSDINETINATAYHSDPWVLIQVYNLINEEYEMAAYQVFKERRGTVDFPRPADLVVDAYEGLSYESAATPEDRFLVIDPDKTYDFTYDIKSFSVAAGDLLIAPYPLNVVIGNVNMVDARGGNMLKEDGSRQRTLWRDVNGIPWIVSGEGKFFHQFFYPLRGDFFFPGAPTGSPVAWLSETPNQFIGDNLRGTPLDDDPKPAKVIYSTYWRSDYPKLKRGETLTYQGGEYFNESPGSEGLPALVAMASAEVIYDSATPSMIFKAYPSDGSHDLSEASARIIRALDRREQLFTVAEMQEAEFTPADTDKIFIVAERWYFRDLPGSLQKRFYFDSLAQKLVFRGLLNEKESGDPDLTAGPDPLNILEPNVMTKNDYDRIRALSDKWVWRSAINSIYLLAQNPHDVINQGISNRRASDPIQALQGIEDAPGDLSAELSDYWRADLSGLAPAIEPDFVHLGSFGVGSALVCNQDILLRDTEEPFYITIVENNRAELNGAPITPHIVEIVPDRYRGALKVLEAADAFSEKVTIQHNGEFGANTGDLYYEWWIRDATLLDIVAQEVLPDGTLKETDDKGNTLWQQYIPKERANLTGDAKNLGLHTIVFEGSPDVTLADKLVLMRYRHKTESDWNLVPFEVADSAAAWKPGSLPPAGPAPFQWAGAANSPQLQADGSKRYIPQLVMGWVKRVLDRINPYEARYVDFFSNESPATYTSQIQIAGAPFAGKVALNSDKNVIENTGLIELYETVLARARELSIENSSNPVASDGIKQALLLAATRLSVLYELLAREAYSDAQDSTITISDDDSIGVELFSAVSFTHAFQNMEADVMHEEMALLRGTDFLKSYPVYNRIFWNYAKGLGEAAYNVNYNIYDENMDGFINEDDARALYPQGHGDAWGHFLSATGMHYALLQQPNFSWITLSELYSLMENVLEVDYLDEKTFAKLAAEKAVAGRDIVRGTYRLAYTQDPDGQWQGYTDGVDPARAWGVSEWAKRAGQGAYFDWAVANALLPEDARDAIPLPNPENLDLLERSVVVDEVGQIAAAHREIQLAADEANRGVNPLGFDSNALAFDLNFELYTNQEGDRTSHFEQIYEKAVEASANALETLKYASKMENKLRLLANDREGLLVEALRQDLDYRNRLIEIFGRPYDGTIGFGKVYPEGYLGPDTLLYAYLDKVAISEIVPQVPSADENIPLRGESGTVHFNNVYAGPDGMLNAGGMNHPGMVDLFKKVWGDEAEFRLYEAFETLIGDNYYQLEPRDGEPSDFTFPYDTASKYAFVAPNDWGSRTSYGRVQRALEEMLVEEIILDNTIADYIAFLQDWEVAAHRLDSTLDLFLKTEDLKDNIRDRNLILSSVKKAYTTSKTVIKIGKNVVKAVKDAGIEAPPRSVGFSNDVTSAIRAAFAIAGAVGKGLLDSAEDIADLTFDLAEFANEKVVKKLERAQVNIDTINDIEDRVESLVNLSGSDQVKRDLVGEAAQNLEIKRQEYITALAEGFRLLREREAFNKVLAANVQDDRYEDMILRLTRNEAMSKYQTAFNHAARYVWLAARAYDYETSLDPGDPASASTLFDKIVKERQLGLWVQREPHSGQGGLAEILYQLNANFQVLKGQLGIDNPQGEAAKMSLRSELFGIDATGPDAGASDATWTDALKARIVPNLNTLPEFLHHCRPFATPEEGAQPGIVIRFSSEINNGVNFFGNPLKTGDNVYSTANYATKIHSAGIFLDNYDAAELTLSPRAYLVPVGTDYMRTSSSPHPKIRSWDVVEQRIPVPYTINQSEISEPGYIPTLDGLDGGFGDLRRHGNMLMRKDDGANEVGFFDELYLDRRLVSRSVWNSEWLLIIPGAGLDVDPMEGLTKFAENVSDIKLYFQTYSHQGQ